MTVCGPVAHSALDTARLVDHVACVQSCIQQAARRAGRDADSVRLLAATKGVSPDGIRAALRAGVRLFGENRVQEALPKLRELGTGPIEWHFIGHLQRRKARDVVGRVAMIQSIDTLALAQEVDRRAESAGIVQPALIEVNLAREAGKHGVAPEDLLAVLAACDGLRHLEVRGLMAIPPAVEEADLSRPYFRTLRELAASASRRGFHRVQMQELSMGMSQDFEVAIEEGATIVRIGTAIFGARE